MAWRQKKSTSNILMKIKFNKFFKKKIMNTKFTNKIYDRNFDNDNKALKVLAKKSYHEGFDPTRDNE